jgi:hypothetical protein
MESQQTVTAQPLAWYQLPNTRVTYNYRYFLPYAPEWGSQELCDRRLQELVTFCRTAEIDAVQFYVNILPGTYYMPAHNAAEQAHWAAWMKSVVAPTLREAGVSYQLNYQMLLGATPYKLDMRDEYPWEFLVNQYGEETLGCACPIGPVFREVMGEMLRLWADTDPDIIWIDDDFRLHNHGLGNGELDYYCYCPRHLQAFADRVGRYYDRETLVAELVKPGTPSPLRAQWMDFLGETMVDSANWVREQVQAVSPRTRLALMTSVPDVHSVEGRPWKAFLEALSGPYPPMTRPCCGVYTGTSVAVKDNAITYRFMGHSIAVLEHAFGPGVVDYGPELENTRFTTWAKSVAHTRHVLEIAQLLGCPQITLSINDLEGSPIDEESATIPMLVDARPRLQALADLELRRWQPQGVIFLDDPHAARKVQVGEEAKMQDLGLLRQWEDVLLQVGIPAYYATSAQAAASPNVVVLEGYTAWCPSDDELQRILAGAVLLDADAVAVLQQRGFGHLLGVEVGPRMTYGIMSERYAGGILPGASECRMPHRGFDWRTMTLAGATAVSQFINGKFQHFPGSAIFENSLGGRVGIYASVGDLSSSGIFGSHGRLRWLHGMLRWLSRDTFCALPVIAHHGLTVVRTDGNRQLLAFANLGTDVLHELAVRLPGVCTGDTVQVLDAHGRWQPQACQCSPVVDGWRTMTIPCELGAFGWLMVMRTIC